MDPQPLITRAEVEAAFFALYDLLEERSARSDSCSKVTMAKKKYKKIWESKEAYDAWNAHVDETLRRLREAAESIRARGEKGEAPEPR